MNDQHHPAHQPKLPKLPKLNFNFKKVNFKTLVDGLKDVVEILKLNQGKMHEVAAREEEGVGVALVYLLVGQLANALGYFIFGFSIPFVGTVHLPFERAFLFGLIEAVMVAVIFYLVAVVVQNYFKGSGSVSGYLRVVGYASFINVVGVLAFLPILASLASIWFLVVNYFILKAVHKLTPVNIFFVMLIACLIGGILYSFLSPGGWMFARSGGPFSLTY